MSTLLKNTDLVPTTIQALLDYESPVHDDVRFVTDEDVRRVWREKGKGIFMNMRDLPISAVPEIRRKIIAR